jgi:predicted nuclease of restriction endonuclease-like (RecB) superfamily
MAQSPHHELAFYNELLSDIKQRIQLGQTRAALSANAEMLMTYWDIGHMLHLRQQEEGWGAGVIPKLSKDLRNDLPEVKGFSERNLKLMAQFYREYPELSAIGQQAVAQLGTGEEIQLEKEVTALVQPAPEWLGLVYRVSWTHNILLIQKLKDLSLRRWYLEQSIANGWGRDTLAAMIKNKTHERQGRAVSNFKAQLPSPQSDLVQQLLKDPYQFDFLTLTESFREHELEAGLIAHLEKFLLELGAGFAFVGRQYHLEVSDNDFYIDLLFYHLRLRCFVVIELKKGEFKPEYAGKLNFYCNVVDDKLKHETDEPTIGLILCQGKDRILAEYSLRGIQKPIGVADYELTQALPKELKSSLPTVEEIEAELSMELAMQEGGEEGGQP